MTRRVLKSILCVVLIVLIGRYTIPLKAQATAPTCTIDLSQVTALVSQAQAKASSGDNDGAIALLNQVAQTISAIKTLCAGVSADLPQSYSDPSGLFSVNYPAGWTAQLLPGVSDQQGAERPILFANEQSVYDGLMNNQSFPSGQGVTVYVGTAKQVAEQMNALESNKSYDGMVAVTLLEEIINGLASHSVQFASVERIGSIGAYQAAQVYISFRDSSGATTIVDGKLLIAQFGSDQFALVLGVAGPGNSDLVAPIVRSIAATLKVRATK